MNDDYTISLERIDTLFLAVALTPTCFACREVFTTTDKVYVRVQVYGQMPLRFHDGYCMQHFTLGCYAFLENRAEMVEQGVLQ